MTSVTAITVRYNETDRMGITHHAVYPVWYEQARTEFIKKLGISYSQVEQLGVMLPLVDLSCHYAGSCTYENQLEVSVKVTQLTPARIRFFYAITKKGEEKPFHTGSTTHAWVDSASFRVINLKKRLPELYEKIASAVEPEE